MMKKLLSLFLALTISTGPCSVLAAPIAVQTVNGVSPNLVTGDLAMSATQAFSAKGVALNATGDPASIAIPVAIIKYSVSSVVITNCSATPILASVGIYTAASAGGTVVVTPATITGATGATVIISPTIAAATTALTASSLFVHVSVANAAAMTCDFYVMLTNLS